MMKINNEVENTIIFNSDDYIEEDWEYILEDLDYLLSETIREPRGEIVGWVFLSTRSSHYGNICNHGQTGYRKHEY